MALMPPDGYPIQSFAQLRAAVEQALYDQQAALAVRNSLLEAQYYRALVASGQMNRNQYFIALEELKKLQQMAAEKGMELGFDIRDESGRVVRQLNPLPPAIEPAKSQEVASKEPLSPEGVHFTSHQRVGDTVKDSYIEHVHEMFAGGYIDAGEHDARLAALMLARTKEEMEFLVQDLPQVNERKPLPEVVTESTDGKLTIDPLAGLMLMFVSCLGTVAVIANNAPSFSSISTAVLMMVIAIATCIFTIRGITFKRKNL
jgi:hypothetical protein